MNCEQDSLGQVAKVIVIVIVKCKV